MIAQFLTAHKTIPSVEVLIQEQMLCAAVRTLGYDPKEEARVKLSSTRDNLATPFMGRSRMSHLERIAPAGTLDMSDVLMLFRFRGLRYRASHKMPRRWNHCRAFQHKRFKGG